MKWPSATGFLCHMFVLTAAFSAGLFFVLGMAGIIQAKWLNVPVSSLKVLAASVSSPFFQDMLGMEIPFLRKEREDSTFSQENMSQFLFQFMTSVNPGDPKTLLAGELPGVNHERASLLFRGKGTDSLDFPFETIPPAEVFERSPSPRDKPGNMEENEPKQPETAPEPDPKPEMNLPKTKEKVVFVYQTHNTESFLPELKDKGITDSNKAYDPKINVTLVGKRIVEQLEKRGIGAVHSDVNYPQIIEDFNFTQSYDYSRKTVLEAFQTHKSLMYMFDIHRDSQSRSKTTVRIKGVDYAQVYFVIGKKNPDWEKNLEFAKKLHERLEKLQPGISRGIFEKSSHGNAEYNQSLFANNILLEIGGPYNTLEECYRTADILAKAIAELYWEAQEVDSPAKRTVQSASLSAS